MSLWEFNGNSWGLMGFNKETWDVNGTEEGMKTSLIPERMKTCGQFTYNQWT